MNYRRSLYDTTVGVSCMNALKHEEAFVDEYVAPDDVPSCVLRK
jgi:hypothetical protein